MRARHGDGSATAMVSGFVQALRAERMSVPPSSALRLAAALKAIDGLDAEDLYWVGRITLVPRAEDLPAYDEVFARYWARAAGEPRGDPGAGPEDAPRTAATSWRGEEDAGVPGAQPSHGDVGTRYSRIELLRHGDMAGYGDDELGALYDWMRRLRQRPVVRRTWRRAPTRRARGHVDTRATLRRSLRTDGEIVRLIRRARARRPRPLVFLCDVSGSMQAYARGFLLLCHASVWATERADVFTIGTNLTRITDAFSHPDPRRVLTVASARGTDWGGGTRLGEAIGEFNADWSARLATPEAAVVVFSDGLDFGDPDRISAATAALRRRCARLVWVNPLKASPGYQPLARGMAAALPHVDAFVEGHSADAVRRLFASLRRPTVRDGTIEAAAAPPARR